MQKIFSNIDGLIVRPSGPWVKRKYHYLERYIDIFTRAMHKKWNGDLTFIDLFAGPGRCLVESSGEEKDGSPLIALNHNFSNYIFIEEDGECLSALRQRCSQSPKLSRIEFINGDCNKVVDKILTTGLSLAFIDPTNINIHFDTIRNLITNSRAVDLLVNVQFGMDIKRNFKQYKEKGKKSPLNLFLGGNIDLSRLITPQDVISEFKMRIRQLGYASIKDIDVRNTKNVPMYFLFFASRSPVGVRFWDKISKIDEFGQRELF